MTVSLETPTATDAPAWADLNQAYLERTLERLRLLVRRRILWLRARWSHDPLGGLARLAVSDEEVDDLALGDKREAERRFYREHSAAMLLGEEIAARERDLEELRATMRAGGGAPALDVLAERFGLPAFDRDVVALCLAPQVDAAFERLYAYVQNDATRMFATPQLALELLPGDQPTLGPGDARARLLPEAPLRRFRLVVQEQVTGAAALRLDDRMVAYLHGHNRPDDRVALLLRRAIAPLSTAADRELAASLASLVTDAAERGVYPAVNLTGPADAGKRAIAIALCAELGLGACALDPRLALTSGEGFADSLALLEREAGLLGTGFYFEVDGHGGGQREARSAGELVDGLGALIVVGSLQRLRAERPLVCAAVEKPDAGAQRELWLQALGRRGRRTTAAVDAVVQQFELGPEAIVAAVESAKTRAALRSENPAATPGPDDLWRACREQAAWRVDGLGRAVAGSHSWDDIVLPEDLRRQLEELAGQAVQRGRVYDAWGFGARLSRGRGITALFAGPSGTGKTMAAEILAGHLDLDLLVADVSAILDKYIGETEKNLRQIFDAAESRGAVLFFDEADALFGKRTEVRDSRDRYSNIEINYLLQRMEAYRGLAILATNRKSVLDQAFLRRLRFLLEFPFPDRESRRLIWERVFPPETPRADLDYDALARLEIPGGNIRTIAVNAAFLAAGAEEAVAMKHVLHAARREYAKLGKLVTEAEFGAFEPAAVLT